MLDAQSTEEDGVDLNSLIAGNETEERKKQQKRTFGTVKSSEHNGSDNQQIVRHPFANKSKGLTDSEVTINAFLVLLAG